MVATYTARILTVWPCGYVRTACDARRLAAWVATINLLELMVQIQYYAEKMIALSFLLSLLACLLCTGVEGKLILIGAIGERFAIVLLQIDYYTHNMQLIYNVVSLHIFLQTSHEFLWHKKALMTPTMYDFNNAKIIKGADS